MSSASGATPSANSPMARSPRAPRGSTTRSEFPWDNVKKMADLGLLGILFPEQYGGAGLGHPGIRARGRGDLERLRLDRNHPRRPRLARHVADLQSSGPTIRRRSYLPPLCSGERLAAFGLTEPEAGCDAGGTKTRAVLDGPGYTINGRKIYITNGRSAARRFVTAVTTPGIGVKGITPSSWRRGRLASPWGRRKRSWGIAAAIRWS